MLAAFMLAASHCAQFAVGWRMPCLPEGFCLVLFTEKSFYSQHFMVLNSMQCSVTVHVSAELASQPLCESPTMQENSVNKSYVL